MQLLAHVESRKTVTYESDVSAGLDHITDLQARPEPHHHHMSHLGTNGGRKLQQGPIGLPTPESYMPAVPAETEAYSAEAPMAAPGAHLIHDFLSWRSFTPGIQIASVCCASCMQAMSIMSLCMFSMLLERGIAARLARIPWP